MTERTHSARADSTRATVPAAGGLRPHEPLIEYYADEGERHRFLCRMFDDTAVDYDRMENLLALGSGRWYRRQALLRAGLGAGADVVDVGIGTGLLAREALHCIGPAGSLVGVDPSPGMLAQVALDGIEIVQGRAEALGREPASADFITMGYVLRHLSDVDAALAEFFRVLRPGGRLLILEITRPQRPLAATMLKLYMRTIVPALARLVARNARTPRLWRYYWDTIDACIAPARVLDAMRNAGFVDVRRYVELGMFSEYTACKPVGATDR